MHLSPKQVYQYSLVVLIAYTMSKLAGCATVLAPPISNVSAYKLQTVQVVWQQNPHVLSVSHHGLVPISDTEKKVATQASIGFLNDMHEQTINELAQLLSAHGVKSGGDTSLIVWPAHISYFCDEGLINPFTHTVNVCPHHDVGAVDFYVSLESKNPTAQIKTLWSVRIQCNLTKLSNVSDIISKKVIKQLESSGWIGN